MAHYDFFPYPCELISVATIETVWQAHQLMDVLQHNNLPYRIQEWPTLSVNGELPPPGWGMLYVEKGREEEAIRLFKQMLEAPEHDVHCVDCGLAIDETTIRCPACGAIQKT